MQSGRNNGRAVYRSKEKVIMYQGYEYIYLYSFNAEEYADDEIYEAIKSHSGDWMVSFTKSSMIMSLFKNSIINCVKFSNVSFHFLSSCIDLFRNVVSTLHNGWYVACIQDVVHALSLF